MTNLRVSAFAAMVLLGSALLGSVLLGSFCTASAQDAALGEKDQAFAWLERACDDHSYEIVFLNVDPLFDGLRNDPRFPDLLRRAGLAPRAR